MDIVAEVSSAPKLFLLIKVKALLKNVNLKVMILHLLQISRNSTPAKCHESSLVCGLLGSRKTKPSAGPIHENRVRFHLSILLRACHYF